MEVNWSLCKNDHRGVLDTASMSNHEYHCVIAFSHNHALVLWWLDSYIAVRNLSVDGLLWWFRLQDTTSLVKIKVVITSWHISSNIHGKTRKKNDVPFAKWPWCSTACNISAVPPLVSAGAPRAAPHPAATSSAQVAHHQRRQPRRDLSNRAAAPPSDASGSWRLQWHSPRLRWKPQNEEAEKTWKNYGTGGGGYGGNIKKKVVEVLMGCMVLGKCSWDATLCISIYLEMLGVSGFGSREDRAPGPRRRQHHK